MARGRPWAVLHHRSRLLLFLYAVFLGTPSGGAAGKGIDVGVVLDMGTLVGKMCWASVLLAAEDFYAANPNYTTKLALHARDAKADVVGAGSAALGLLKNDGVVAILGPQKSFQARFLSGMANKTQVPIISFTATSPLLLSSAEPYFVRAALNDSSQVHAIASVVKAYRWREVVLIYEDTEYGVGVIPYLIDAMQAVNVRVPHRSVISPSATDDAIMAELYKLMTMQTRVFIVHMSLQMGTRVFAKARTVGMMSEGYAWIVMGGIGSLVDSLDPAVIGNMQGFLAVMPYIHKTREFTGFRGQWKSKYRSLNPGEEKVEPSIYSLWAYDAVRALAMAVERVGRKMNFTFQRPVDGSNTTDLDKLAVSTAGPELLKAVYEKNFSGLSGEFRLVDGELQVTGYQIINVAGNEQKVVGYWTPAYGLSRQLKKPAVVPGTSNETLASVVWPGDTTVVPRGWVIPTWGKRLRVAVPKKMAFLEFVDVHTDPTTNQTITRGYSIDIFDKVMASLPYPVLYDYVPYDLGGVDMSASYSELVKQVFFGKFDAVAGDVTILEERLQYVDFTLPYTDSGVYMIVRLEEDKRRSTWIFFKPLTLKLWLACLLGFLLTGLVVWVIEERSGNEEFRAPLHKVAGNVLYFTFSTLVFAQKDNLKSTLSKAVVIVWVFVVLILTSSYTASLASLLTVEQLRPSVSDIDELIKSSNRVGYASGSYLIDRLKQFFAESRLVPLTGVDEYATALSNGTVAAVFHELPYIKIFLKKYCTGYKMIDRPATRAGGLGFVFPKDSPLVSDVSAAVLEVTQGPDMDGIENRWLGINAICQAQDDGAVALDTRLTFSRLRGLFFVIALTWVGALLLAFVKPRKGNKKVAPSPAADDTQADGTQADAAGDEAKRDAGERQQAHSIVRVDAT